MDSLELFYSLLTILMSAAMGVAGTVLYFTKLRQPKRRKYALRRREDKLDRCIEALIEYNALVGRLNQAISGFISFGSEDDLKELKEADSAILGEFKIFYAIEAYLLAIDALEPHEIMCEYIELIAKLRKDFHYSNDKLSLIDFEASVVRVKDCRKRFYSSLNSCYNAEKV